MIQDWTKNLKGWMEHCNEKPTSKDFNVLDLGFFNSIQSLQHQESPDSLDEFIKCAIQAYNKFNHDNL